METSKLRKFAAFARKALIEQVGIRLKSVLAEGSLARRESTGAVAELEKRIKELGKSQVIETAAYTWFNRFCALRYMDVNRYTRIGVLSPAEGQFQPEILAEAKMGHIDEEMVPEKVRQKVLRILDESDPSPDPQGEAYRLLLVAVCNYYHSLMPFMFEKITDYTELLLPDDLLSGTSIPAYTREALIPANCSPEHTEESVEVIGWLYQFYISEKKDDVFAALKKGKKITPENIPAATQLFTPHWIVRYLVENSLGRLWMLNHSDSRLIDQMDYYIRPEVPETDFLRISSPEEIKICDPACGSGHMLTYAFDLLYAIYEEQGYPATDIPRLILTHNLYGIEIDQRAGALAAFALTMKAREKYRRFLTGGKVVQPNICVLENIFIDPEDLSAYMDKVGRDLFSGGLQGVVTQWEEADNFGSLIRPLVTDVSEVLELLRERQMGEDLFLAGVHQQVLEALRQADYLSPKYHVVVANPPYMFSKGMNDSLKRFASEHFSESKADAFAMFVRRCLDLAQPRCLMAMITQQSWMFLATFEKLRESLFESNTVVSVAHLGPRAFDTIGGEVVSTAAFIFEKKQDASYESTFIRLVDGDSEAEKSSWLRSAVADAHHANKYRLAVNGLRAIPGWPLAYWLSKSIVDQFAACPSLGSLVSVRGGMTTGDNDEFVRYWYEGSRASTAHPDEGPELRDHKWHPYNKGGSYRKWFGNRFWVVNWLNDGFAVKETGRASVRSEELYFREMVGWTDITGFTQLGIRYYGEGFIFDASGPAIFTDGTLSPLAVLSFLGTKITSTILGALNPTLHVQAGNISALPWINLGPDQTKRRIADVTEMIAIARRDWDEFEQSWDFEKPPILCSTDSVSLKSRYDGLRRDWFNAVGSLTELEKQNNTFWIEHFDVGEELSADVPRDEITLECNPYYRYGSDKSESELEALLLADTMREFISYAVGCMLGRYSLDKPGLILANQGETADDYRQQIPDPTFATDEDNVIPLLDGDWFTDDISERFKEFLKVTFGAEHYEENLTFLENALYPDNLTGKKRKTIRDYFLKEFYNHHIKLYKKRPIYWLFSSPKGTFNALIYMHRYRPDTVSVVLGYLRDFRDKLTHHTEHLQSVADRADGSKTEKTKALKQITELKKQLKELDDYERKTLFPLAQKQIDIDLDDGVKVNYTKFGAALKKIPGLDKKEA